MSSIFEQSVAEVFRLMHTDSLRRFFLTRAFQCLVREEEEEEEEARGEEAVVAIAVENQVSASMAAQDVVLQADQVVANLGSK